MSCRCGLNPVFLWLCCCAFLLRFLLFFVLRCFPLPQDPERYFPEFSYDSFKVVFFPFGLSLIWNRGRKKEGVKGWVESRVISLFTLHDRAWVTWGDGLYWGRRKIRQKSILGHLLGETSLSLLPNSVS